MNVVGSRRDAKSPKVGIFPYHPGNNANSAGTMLKADQGTGTAQVLSIGTDFVRYWL